MSATTLAPAPQTLLDVYDRLVRARPTRRHGFQPATPAEEAATAQAVARRILIENHKAEYEHLYKQVRRELARGEERAR